MKGILIWEENTKQNWQKCFSLFNSSKICVSREVLASCTLLWSDYIRNAMFSSRYHLLKDINKLKNICWRKTRMIRKLKLSWEEWLGLDWNMKVFIKYLKRHCVKREIELFNVGSDTTYMANRWRLWKCIFQFSKGRTFLIEIQSVQQTQGLYCAD